MKVQRGFHGIACIGLLALLYSSAANFDRDAKAALHPNRDVGLAHSDSVASSADANANANVPLDEPEANVRSLEASDDVCALAQYCIDQYLWSIYERARKIDTMKVREQFKTTVKKKGKRRTVVKTVVKFVPNDFTWKDPEAAEKAGMSLQEYVIGGMDKGFKLKLYHLVRAMDNAGLGPGITSGFRDDYRQSIASGNKAASDSSYHGGSRRGGYGYGLAADLVSVNGPTRSELSISNEILWKWIDEHGNEFGVGRPYLDRDPPHVGPTEGREYLVKRGLNVKRAGL